jgi:hypothetical protein
VTPVLAMNIAIDKALSERYESSKYFIIKMILGLGNMIPLG